MLEVQLRELKSTAEHELKSLKPNRQTADDPSSTCSELHLSTQEVIADPLGVIAGPPTQPSEEVFALGFLNSGAGCSQGSALFQLSRICSDGLVLWYAGPRGQSSGVLRSCLVVLHRHPRVDAKEQLEL